MLSVNFCSLQQPDRRSPGELHGVGGDALPPQVHWHVLRLHPHRQPLGEPAKPVIHRPRGHRDRVLK